MYYQDFLNRRKYYLGHFLTLKFESIPLGEKYSLSNKLIFITSSARLYKRNCIGAFHFGLIVRLTNGVFNVNDATVISQYGSIEPKSF